MPRRGPAKKDAASTAPCVVCGKETNLCVFDTRFCEEHLAPFRERKDEMLDLLRREQDKVGSLFASKMLDTCDFINQMSRIVGARAFLEKI